MRGTPRSAASTRGSSRARSCSSAAAKIALVAADLASIPGGLAEAGRAPAPASASATSSCPASHTHAAPTGFSNFRFNNAVITTPPAPDVQRTRPDPQLYAFMVRQLAQAIRRADDDLAPAVAGWGGDRLSA